MRGAGHRAQGTGRRAQGTEHRVQGTGHRAQGKTKRLRDLGTQGLRDREDFNKTKDNLPAGRQEVTRQKWLNDEAFSATEWRHICRKKILSGSGAGEEIYYMR